MDAFFCDSLASPNVAPSAYHELCGVGLSGIKKGNSIAESDATREG